MVEMVGLETRIAGRGETVEVALSGELDLSSGPRLQACLTQLLATGHPDIVLDLARLTFIDASGLGIIVGAVERARSMGGDIALRSVPKAGMRVLEVTRLTDVIHVESTQDNASVL